MSWGDRVLGLPRRPPSEVEWEDLLVRLELMPRALDVVLDQVDPRASAVFAVLDALAARERWAGRLLEAAATGSAETVAGRAGPRAPENALDTLDEFVRNRRRNFAMVQRRGVDVWEWAVADPDADAAGTPATVYQLLTFLALSDVEALASLRSVRTRARC